MYADKHSYLLEKYYLLQIYIYTFFILILLLMLQFLSHLK